MKLYISAASISEIRDAQRVYDARKARYDARMAEVEQDVQNWKAACSAWEEELKTNPAAPRPDPDVIKKVRIHPRYDPEYEIKSSLTELTAKVLNYISGKELAVRSKSYKYWIIVRSGPYTPKTGTYYKCIIYSEDSFVDHTVNLIKQPLDRIYLALPIEILTFEELAEHLTSSGFIRCMDPEYILDYIYEHARISRR